MSNIHNVLSIVSLVTLAALARPVAAEPKAPYEVKAGVLEIAPLMKGMQVTEYFDDFGRKKATFTSFAMLGQQTHKVKIELPDGTIYEVDLDARTGTRMRIDPAAAQAMADALTPVLTSGAKAKDLPSQTFLGKVCKGAEAEVMGMTTRVFTWKGIVLHTEMRRGPDKPMVIDVIKLTEGPVPAAKFEVPAGVKIQDLNAGH